MPMLSTTALLIASAALAVGITAMTKDDTRYVDVSGASERFVLDRADTDLADTDTTASESEQPQLPDDVTLIMRSEMGLSGASLAVANVTAIQASTLRSQVADRTSDIDALAASQVVFDQWDDTNAGVWNRGDGGIPSESTISRPTPPNSTVSILRALIPTTCGADAAACMAELHRSGLSKDDFPLLLAHDIDATPREIQLALKAERRASRLGGDVPDAAAQLLASLRSHPSVIAAQVRLDNSRVLLDLTLEGQ